MPSLKHRHILRLLFLFLLQTNRHKLINWSGNNSDRPVSITLKTNLGWHAYWYNLGWFVWNVSSSSSGRSSSSIWAKGQLWLHPALPQREFSRHCATFQRWENTVSSSASQHSQGFLIWPLNTTTPLPHAVPGGFMLRFAFQNALSLFVVNGRRRVQWE